MEKLKKLLPIIFNFQTWRTHLRNLPHYVVKVVHTIIIFSSFFLLLTFFICTIIFKLLQRTPLIGRFVNRITPIWDKIFKKHYTFILDKMESLRPFKVKRHYLIYIAYQNLLARKSRSLITIFGMAIGVGIIVYLLSLGYGIERLVINQIASLEELQMVDISAGESSSLRLNKKAADKIKNIPSVEKVIPLISVVGRLNYKNAKTDLLVYAVPSEYLETTKIGLKQGNYFTKSKAAKASGFTEKGDVAGVGSTLEKKVTGQPITDWKVNFNIIPGAIAPVWKTCDMDSELLGVTFRSEGELSGREFWGSEYAPFSPYGRSAYDPLQKRYLGKWVKSEFPLYTETEKDGEVQPVLDNHDRHAWISGCIQRKNIQITQEIPVLSASVLGESTFFDASSEAVLAAESEVLAAETGESTPSASLFPDAAVVSTDSAGLEIVQLQATDSAQKKNEQKVLQFKEKPTGEAIISTGLLKLLNMSESSATKEKFNISFIIIKSLMPEIQGRIFTAEVEYKVVGIIEDDESQFIYVPYDDMNKLGITNFSELKVVLKNQKNMDDVRRKIETMGYNTASTRDTVSQVEQFFANLRTLLGFLGFIALGVASLGMFNTLTVSLLERTREIGGMKTMGMVSAEIQELFLAEAMIMGMGGGICGLFLGFFVGKLTSYAVSIIAISQGIGYLELTSIPFHLTAFIIISSFVVGVITGLYPAYRARHISALNALRYE